ncbi:MAG: aldo/keto reductase [Actinomycetia bacterium]|nr:aldo/keto reductase [Actinomycetes bacterium]
MEYRTLGRSGLQVSEIAYGNWIIRPSEGQDLALKEALEQGITMFDTADIYGGGLGEELLGKTLSSVRRETVQICTKVYSRSYPGPNGKGLSRKHITDSVHASLRRLRTDYIDLYQAHRYDPQTPLEETLRTFDDLVRQGKVLYIGVSEWTAAQIRDGLRIAGELGLERIISNQPQYNMLWRVIEADVIPACEEGGLSQIAWSPMAQGLLAGKYRPGKALPLASRAQGPARSQFATGGLADEVLTRVSRLATLAADLGITMPQLAIAWVLSNPNVSAAIIGASEAAQVKENVAAPGVKLDPAALSTIDQILGPVIERDPGKTPSQPGDYGK